MLLALSVTDSYVYGTMGSITAVHSSGRPWCPRLQLRISGQLLTYSTELPTNSKLMHLACRDAASLVGLRLEDSIRLCQSPCLPKIWPPNCVLASLTHAAPVHPGTVPSRKLEYILLLVGDCRTPLHPLWRLPAVSDQVWIAASGCAAFRRSC